MKSYISLLTLASIVAGAATPPSYGSNSEPYEYVGRVNPATKELSWPSSGVAFKFKGTTATIDVISISGTNSVDLIIDGAAPIVIPNVNSSITTPCLSHGTHTIMLRKRSEAVYGSIFLGNITTDGTFTTYKPPTKHQIEIIGDSISVGYGLDGTFPCINSAALEDNPMTYEAVAANALNADYSVIAWSGKGLIRNIATGSVDTSPLMPELWTRYGANDADNSYTFPSSWNPKAVVITLGTNDFSYLAYAANGTAYDARAPINATLFEDGAVNFVKRIKEQYKQAHFFLLSSPMLSDYYPTTADAQHTTQNDALKAAVARIGSRAHFVDWPTQGSVVGCDYHPDAATHAAEGAVLAEAISSALGWKISA